MTIQNNFYGQDNFKGGNIAIRVERKDSEIRLPKFSVPSLPLAHYDPGQITAHFQDSSVI